MKYVFDRQFGRLFERAGLDVRELLMGAHLPEDLFGRRDVMLSKEEYYRLMATAGAADDAGGGACEGPAVATAHPTHWGTH